MPLAFERMSDEEQLERSARFLARMRERRTVRDFSRESVPGELVLNAVATAGTAPSGAHQQPWTFVVVSDPDVKRRIRVAAEEEERRSYEERMPDEWLEALRALGTGWRKPHLEDAPFLVAVFEQAHGVRPDGSKVKHYYVKESVGIAVGLLLASLHEAGLATLTHTPSPMGFLREILERPANERPYVIVPVGYPADGAPCRISCASRSPRSSSSARRPPARACRVGPRSRGGCSRRSRAPRRSEPGARGASRGGRCRRDHRGSARMRQPRQGAEGGRASAVPTRCRDTYQKDRRSETPRVGAACALCDELSLSRLYTAAQRQLHGLQLRPERTK